MHGQVNKFTTEKRSQSRGRTNPVCTYSPLQETESLLSQKGQAKGRMQELTSLCERQRLKLTEATLRARELERLASAAKEATRLAEAQVREDFGRSWRGRLGCFFRRQPRVLFPLDAHARCRIPRRYGSSRSDVVRPAGFASDLSTKSHATVVSSSKRA